MRALQRYAKETDEQYEVCLEDLTNRDHQRRGLERDEQKARRNQWMREYRQ